MTTRIDKKDRAWTAWPRQRDSIKTRWVVAASVFWTSAAVVALVYFLKGEFNLILVSIALGLMVVGIWLKTQIQLHDRK